MTSKSKWVGIKFRAKKYLPRLIVILVLTPSIYLLGSSTNQGWAKDLAGISPIIGGIAFLLWLVVVLGGEKKNNVVG